MDVQLSALVMLIVTGIGCAHRLAGLDPLCTGTSNEGDCNGTDTGTTQQRWRCDIATQFTSTEWGRISARLEGNPE